MNSEQYVANPSANSRRYSLRRWYVKELINVVESFFLFLKVRMQEKKKEVPGNLFSRGWLLANLNHLEIYSSNHYSEQFLPVHVIAPRPYFQRYLQKFHHTSFCHLFRWTYFYVVYLSFFTFTVPLSISFFTSPCEGPLTYINTLVFFYDRLFFGWCDMQLAPRITRVTAVDCRQWAELSALDLRAYTLYIG